MKNKSQMLFLQKLTLILISIFAVAIAIATFIEDKYDTVTAKELIYNARWMEALLLLLVITLTLVIFKRKLYRKEKLTIFLFHLGFIFMIIGAGATRYVGSEGMMHIREGESSNIVYSSETYFRIQGLDNESVKEFEIDRSKASSDPFNYSFNIDGKGEVEVSYKKYIFNAVQEITENTPGGMNMFEVRVATPKGNVSDFIKEGEVIQIGGINIAFNNSEKPDAVQVVKTDDGFQIKAPVDLYRLSKNSVVEDSIPAGNFDEFGVTQIYQANGIMFMFVKYYVKGKKQLVNGNPDINSWDVVVVDVTYKNKTHEVEIYGGNGNIAFLHEYQIDDLTLKMAYGNKPTELSFSIFLENFIL